MRIYFAFVIKLKANIFYLKVQLQDLNLEWRLMRDKNGNRYSYWSNDKYAIIGTSGADGKWEIDRTSIDSIFQDDKEFFYQIGDDLLVKFMPVMR